MTGARSGYSSLGIASFVLSFIPVILLVGAYWLSQFLLSMAPPGAEETGYAFWGFMLLLLTILSELMALGIGVAGALQRHRKRLFAILGVVCSVLVLAAINSQVGLVDLAYFIADFPESQPKVHIVSPGHE